MPFAAGISGATTMYDQTARAGKSGSFNAYFDGLFGVSSKSGSDYTSFAADGENGTVKCVGPISDIAASATTVSLLAGQPLGSDYISGGPVVRIAGSATVLAMIVHLELWPLGGQGNFWASLGVSKSTDGGSSWTCLGEILTLSYAYNPLALTGQQDVEGGPLVPSQDGVYYYMYYREYTAIGTSYLSVARCSIASFESAVTAGSVPTFDKWQGGTTWAGSNTGTALNLSSELHWGDCWYDEDIKGYLYIGNYNLPTQAEAQVRASISSNGLVWEPPITVSDETHLSESATYNSLMPATLTGDRRGRGPWTAVYLYGVRWTAAIVQARTIDLSFELDRRARMTISGGRS
jgi:hypothetical protein